MTVKTLVAPRVFAQPKVRTILVSTHQSILDKQAASHQAELARVRAEAAKAATVAKSFDVRSTLPAAPAPASAPPTGRPWTDSTRWEAYEHILKNRGAAAAQEWAKTFLPRAVKS